MSFQKIEDASLINDEHDDKSLVLATWILGHVFVGFAQVLHRKDRFAERPPKKTVQPQDSHGHWA